MPHSCLINKLISTLRLNADWITSSAKFCCIICLLLPSFVAPCRKFWLARLDSKLLFIARYYSLRPFQSQFERWKIVTDIYHSIISTWEVMGQFLMRQYNDPIMIASGEDASNLKSRKIRESYWILFLNEIGRSQM